MSSKMINVYLFTIHSKQLRHLNGIWKESEDNWFKNISSRSYDPLETVSTKTQHSGNTGLQARQAEHRVQKDQKSYLFQSMTERKNSTRISCQLRGLHCKKVSLVTIVGEAKIRRQKRLHHICLNNHLDLTKKHTMMPMQGRIEVDKKSECWEKKVESGRLCTYYIYEIYNTVNCVSIRVLMKRWNHKIYMSLKVIDVGDQVFSLDFQSLLIVIFEQTYKYLAPCNS